MKKDKLTLERLVHVLYYNQDTGIFKWATTLCSTAKINTVAGTIDDKGYIQIQIDGCLFYAHQLAWFYIYKHWPLAQIDHIDTTKNHNWISNLRESTPSTNGINRGNPKNNTSGIKGIYWARNKNKWLSSIRINNCSHYLGIYKDFNEAVCTRLAAEQCLDWDTYNSNSPAFDYVERWICGRRLQYKKEEPKYQASP